MKQINEKTWQSDNGLITFIHGDCMEVMAGCKENEFELAVVDPPYGLERFKKGGSHVNKYGSENGKWNNEKPNKSYFNELFRISKKQIIWGGNNFELPTSEYFIIWQKSNAEGFSFAMCEMAWTNCNIPAKVFTKLHVQVDEKRIHPTEKPIALYRWIFKNYAKPTDHIFDSHGGSMSSAIAAHMDGLRMTIIELDEEYFQKAIKRFATYESQQTISFDL